MIDLENVKTSRVGIVHEHGIMSSAYICFRPLKEKIYPKFAYWFFYDLYKKQIYNSIGSGVRSTLSSDDMSEFELPIPQIREQKIISSYLDKKTSDLDSLIQKSKKKIEHLKEHQTSLINHYLTKGLDTNVEMKNSGVKCIDEIPKHWKLSKIKYLSETISKGTTPSTLGEDTIENGKIRYLKSENIVDGKVRENPVFSISSETDELIKRSRLKSSDVLVVIAGAMVGKSAILIDEFLPSNTNQAVSFIRPFLKSYSSLIHMWMSSTYVKMEIQKTSVVSAQPNLSMENLGNFIIPVPPEQEWSKIQFSISEKLKRNDLLLIKEKKKIDLLIEYRQSLISTMVTGKVRVSEDMI